MLRHIYAIDGCDAPPPGTGSSSLVTNPVPVGAHAPYICDAGYAYTGDSADLVITCTAEGWETPPNCQGKVL